MHDETAPVRPSLNKVAVPIVGEFLLGISVAMAGLYLASHTSDAAAGAMGLAQQVQESLAVLFRILAIGLGVLLTQYLGGQRHEDSQRAAYAALGASTWVGVLAALWFLFGDQVTLDWLNAPQAVRPMAGLYMMMLAPAMLLEAYNISMAAVLRAHLFARESLVIMLIMHGTHLALAWWLMRGLGDWPGWGINGYAVAWVLSRAVGLFLHLGFWRMRMGLRPTWRDWWRVPLDVLMPVLRIGLPGAALEFCYRMAFMVSLAATSRLGGAKPWPRIRIPCKHSNMSCSSACRWAGHARSWWADWWAQGSSSKPMPWCAKVCETGCWPVAVSPCWQPCQPLG